MGAPIVPSRYGQKYLYGLVRGSIVSGLDYSRRRHRDASGQVSLQTRSGIDHFDLANAAQRNERPNAEKRALRARSTASESAEPTPSRLISK